MGNVNMFGAKKEPVQLLMVGLDAAGKTTMLYHLKPDVATTIPTIGFNVEQVKMKSVGVTSWDMGGRCPMRPLWRHYYQHTDGIIMVLDSNDRERLPYVSHELNLLLGEEELSGLPLLVLANKQDLPNAMTCNEIVDGLHLNSIRDRAWFIQSCCATTNEGVPEGLDWIKSEITVKKTAQAAIKPFKETVQDAKKVAITDQLLDAFKSFFTTVKD